MDKPVDQMTRNEVLAELAWRNAAQREMVGTLYPAINADRIAALKKRERELEFPPCLTCGKTVNFAGSVKCNGCWEVEARIEEYLKSAGGRDHVMNLLHYNHGLTLAPAEA